MTESLPDILNKLVEDKVNDYIYTALPAKIVKTDFYQTKQTVDVQPVISRLYSDGFSPLPPVIQNVPVLMPSGGGAILSFPVQRDDTVLLVFSKRDMGTWLLSEGKDKVVVPDTSKVFDISDAVAITGLFTNTSNPNPDPENVQLKFEDKSVTLKKGSGDIELANGTQTLTLKDSGDVEHGSGAKITNDGDHISATGISLNNHLHIGNLGSPVGPAY